MAGFVRKLISIITPVHNSQNTITDCISSVLSQTYDQWEMLIVDDCSTDETYNIIEHYLQTDLRIKYIRLDEQSGAAVARNTGISRSRGAYIAFLDSDDLWESSKLFKQYHFMEENRYKFTYTAYDIVDHNNKYIKAFYPREKVNLHLLRKTCDIGCSTVMYSVEQLGKEYMHNIRRGQDYTLWLKILKLDEYGYCMVEKLTKYRIMEKSLSRNKIKKAIAQWHIYRDIEKISFVCSVFYFLHYSYNGLKKNRF